MSGRLTRDAEIKVSNESAIASFGFAVNRRFKNRDGNYEADFFEVKAFGKTAEWVEKYTAKGKRIEIQGRLQQDRWTDDNGNNRSRVVVIADNISFGESKAESQANASPEQQTGQTQPTQNQGKPDENGFMYIPNGVEEELPFN